MLKEVFDELFFTKIELEVCEIGEVLMFDDKMFDFLAYSQKVILELLNTFPF